MQEFRAGLYYMLFGALIAQARLFEFQIEDAAATVFVNRAVDRITTSFRTEQDRFAAARRAIDGIPQFLSNIQTQARTRQILTEASARDAVRSLTRDCFFPWCSDVPRQ